MAVFASFRANFLLYSGFETTAVNLRQDRFFGDRETLVTRSFACRGTARANGLRALHNDFAQAVQQCIAYSGIVLQQDAVKTRTEAVNRVVKIGFPAIPQLFIPVLLFNHFAGILSADHGKTYKIDRGVKVLADAHLSLSGDIFQLEF